MATISRRRRRLAARWRRAGIFAPIISFLLVAFLIGTFFYAQGGGEDEPLYQRSSLLVFVFVYLNIVILCVLAFLVGRNVVKLIFDRRRNILGSKLRMRLVVAFVGLAAIPTSILFILASGLLTRAMEGWFNSQVEASLDSAIEVSRFHLNEVRASSLRSATALAREVHSFEENHVSNDALHDFLESRRKGDHLFSVHLLARDKSVIVEATAAVSGIENFREPAPDRSAVDRAADGEEGVVLVEDREASKFVRVYAPVATAQGMLVLVVTNRLKPDLAQALSVVNDSYRSYQQLKLYRTPLKSWYILTLSMITGSILFGAIWIGFYIAREISVPIQRLAEGTRSVARGNYDVHIRAGGDDEIGILVRSFNSMTADLRQSRADAERRRVYIETILTNLAVAVIALDTQHQVTSVNEAASRLFNFKAEEVLGKGIHEVLAMAHLDQVRPLLVEIAQAGEPTGEAGAVLERELTVSSQGRELRIVLTIGTIVSRDRKVLGTVLLFDDITELAKAQHMSAWREVARRIAHEIKNPLTPIQLSAQRLQKLFSGSAQQQSVIESTQTIVENVNSIKRLANEFSHFARMPTAEFTRVDLNQLIADTIAPFAESHSAILFQFIADNKLPDVTLDREQIRRIVMNLIDNAIAAIKGQERSVGSGPARITIRTGHDLKRRSVTIEIADNGPGIKTADKTRVFEPYFTTKKGGTGLGLAIVTSIVSDHQGEIRLYDNAPQGARFVVELPVMPKSVTQRRFVSSEGMISETKVEET